FYQPARLQVQLNSISAPAQGLRETFDHMDTGSMDGWVNIATRLEGLGATLAGYVATLEQGRTAGNVVAIRQVEETIRQASVTASEGSSFVALIDSYDSAGVGNGSLRSRLVAAIAAARAAYGDLVDYLETTYAGAAAIEDPVGEERYRFEARRFLGTDLDLDETYAWGWDEVERIRERMNQVADEIAPGGSIEDAYTVVKTDPQRSAATPDDLVAFLSARIDEALDRLSGTHFEVPDEIRRCDVKLAPPGGSLGAYYVGPSEDFTRAGSVWWSIERDKPRPLYEDVTTAYHEGFPGHHLQVGIQVSLHDRLSRLHRMAVWMPGTGEGWALYAERLMDELGYLDKPDYLLGYLGAQMLRACRVVVDIGNHLRRPIPDGQPFHPGEAWNFDTSVEMLERYGGMDRPYAVSEVNRYLGWPGQAIAYKVGERQILQIRDELRQRQGNDFDLKDFHRRVLEVGPVGLDLMRRVVLDGAWDARVAKL
ncbi:MAG: DUF885 domain-containing protein, partial [Actinomycetota bacterium]|nr:DUF885 domain-containing protein [Actinomycetota bacterium]